MSAIKFKSTLLIALLTPIILILGCSNISNQNYQYVIPELGDGEIRTSSWELHDVDTIQLIKAIKRIRSGIYKEVHSLLIYKNGNLILEEYFPGHDYKWDAEKHHGKIIDWNRDSLHHLHSVTKSITSACLGAAINKGIIKNVNQSIFEYLPEYQDLNNQGREDITIEHLLTMSPGLEWDEWSSPLRSPENDILGIWYNHPDDPVRGILQRPVIHKPGSFFRYSGGNMIVLGEIIRNASGLDISEFSEKYLFGPIGSDQFDWALRFPNGVYETAGGLRASPRTMLKIGILYLNDGKWNGQQILPPGWSGYSASTFGNNSGINIPGEDLNNMGYGYSWWTKEFRLKGQNINWFSAGGWGGQKIIVLPEKETIIVLTGGTFRSRVIQFRLLKNYIIPAIL